MKQVCTVCGEPATLRSPSGRSDSVYCEKHGHCARCNASVEQFVPNPHSEINFVCPCVAERIHRFDEKEERKVVNQKSLFEEAA